MMDDQRPDARTDGGLPHPGDDPRVAATLAAVVSRLTGPPDEFTARRHLAAIKTAVHDPGRRLVTDPRRGDTPDDATAVGALGWSLLRRSSIATAAAVAVLVMLAGGGLLPDSAQQAVTAAAQRIGVSLPAPATSGEDDGPAEQPPAGDPTDTVDVDAAVDHDASQVAADHDAVDGPIAAAQPVDEVISAAADGGADTRGQAADPPVTHPLWDLHPSQRTPPSQGAAPQRPAEPGPPVVTPPAPVPTPAPGGRAPGPPAGHRKAPAADAGPATPPSNKAAPQAHQARGAVPEPAQDRRH